MFEGYSQRALTVIFIARHIAGHCGSSMMDRNHLLAALIYEDRGELSKLFSELPDLERLCLSAIPKTHESFFASAVASNLLQKIEETMPSSAPVPHSKDLPLSSDLKQTLGKAADLQRQSKQNSVEPLHLLAAILQEGSSQCAAILRRAGVTEDKVIEGLSRLPEASS